MMIDLLIIDDHELTRHGLAKLIEGTNIRICANADNTTDALNLARRHTPSLIILDICMANRSGLRTLKCLKQEVPKIPVLILSENGMPACMSKAKAHEAVGFLSKRCDRRELILAISLATAGEILWTEDQLRQIAGPLAPQSPKVDTEQPLTQRQMEVLRQITHGLTTKEIALSLNIRYDTAKEHVQKIMRKIGASGRTEAAVWAVRQGLV